MDCAKTGLGLDLASKPSFAPPLALRHQAVMKSGIYMESPLTDTPATALDKVPAKRQLSTPRRVTE